MRGSRVTEEPAELDRTKQQQNKAKMKAKDKTKKARRVKQKTELAGQFVGPGVVTGFQRCKTRI